MLIVFKSSLFINDSSKNKEKKKYRVEKISEIIEKTVNKYKIRMAFKNMKTVKILLSSKKSKIILKISVFKDNLYIYLLKNYIYRILNKILKDSKSLELVKKEILKAPRGTFTNFLLLFNDLIEELQKTSNRDSMNIDYIIV